MIWEKKVLFFLPKSSGVLVEKVTEDFWQFIFCPDASSYCLRIRARVAHLKSDVWQKNIVSSAKSR